MQALYEYLDREPMYQITASDDTYVDQMNKILSAFPNIGVPNEPSNIISTVFLGTTANAENVPLLKSMGITYILNCAGGHPLGVRRNRLKYPPESGVKGYEELPIQEWDDENIVSWLDRAHTFIDYARTRGGRVLIHCPGVSRSGAIAISYLCRNGLLLLEATKKLKGQRRCVLSHEGFVRQLVTWARDRGYLDTDVNSVPAPSYMRKIDMYRINSAHMPMFL